MIGMVSPITGIWNGSVGRKDKEVSQHQLFQEKTLSVVGTQSVGQKEARLANAKSRCKEKEHLSCP